VFRLPKQNETLREKKKMSSKRRLDVLSKQLDDFSELESESQLEMEGICLKNVEMKNKNSHQKKKNTQFPN